MSRYELSPEAVDDLVNIREFVSGDSPAAADKLIEEFFLSLTLCLLHDKLQP